MAEAFFDREYTCPICKTTFKSPAVRSSAIYVEKKESDFHTVYRGVNPLYYSVIVCPVCEYAASSNTFNNELPGKTAEQIALALSQLKSEKTPDLCKERKPEEALYAFHLAIRSSQLKKAPPGEIAGLLLASAWIAREIGNQQLEAKFLKEALNYYVEAFSSGYNIPNLNELQLIYLIGELNRRLGNFKEAISWFNRVITHKNIKNFPAIEKMAREQWALAREEMQSCKNDDTPSLNETEETENHAPAAKSDTPGLKTAFPGENKTGKKARPLMQMPAHLYEDQIEWLRKIASQYTIKNKTFTREETLRAVLDALIESIGSPAAFNFSSEEELKNKIRELLTR
ncbi:Uncharacterized protein, DUF2225 family [Thermosyntropha lipolytica DSM 11003]|uniref:Uncharacterized protein, DUF2225 family n=1 Tax=Thermosyntropha lipolytica DSM 11003 TaxID=1123382 RepID=A0A1M5PDP2_9FIRM|nr:DUF2225 domain-containing protein [Thermosyntropha lipolytica]SHG99891.1 Uncharacterized protein, DUF2225 family [Thermosyntropha lipolytica DSM 11003]